MTWQFPPVSTVSPCYLSIAPIARGQRGGDRGGGPVDCSFELASPDDTVVGDPIAGKLHFYSSEAYDRPLDPQKELTAETFSRHCLTRLPYRPGCEYYVASTKPHVHHRRSQGGCAVPFSLPTTDCRQSVLRTCVFPYVLSMRSLVEYSSPVLLQQGQ